MTKNFKSRYFEDYKIDEEINHSVPRTITDGDVRRALINGINIKSKVKNIYNNINIGRLSLELITYMEIEILYVPVHQWMNTKMKLLNK